MSLREERDTQIVYTGSLLNQELYPVPESTRQSTKQSNTDYTQNHQRSDFEPLKKHTSFGTTHTKNVDLDNLKSTQHSLAYNTRKNKVFRTNYTCLQNELNQYKCNPIPLSLEKIKAEKRMFKT